MNSSNLLKSALLGFSIAGLGFVVGPLAAKAAMPSGYTLSSTPIRGQHCYRHNGEAKLYCYRNKITGSTMMQHNTMMKPSNTMMKPGNTMMKSNDSMMKPGNTMMKNDSMMKPGSTMKNDDNTMMKSNDSMMKK